MKIATVTVHHAHNYGAMLQAYALQHALEDLGNEAIILDFDEISSTLYPQRNGKSLKSFLSWCFFSLKARLHNKELRQGFQRFENFYDLELKKTKAYTKIEEIETNEFDMLLVGSDQIWSFKRDGNRPYFQLNFGGDILRASYAASMGSYFSLSKNEEESFKKSLDVFCAVSVREKESAEYINKLTGKECHIDVDPVLLLETEEWDKLANKSCKYELPNKYILCYELFKSSDLYECVKRVQNETGLQVVVLAPNIYYHQHGEIVILDAGPSEMIDLIRKSEIVVTNSYHGTVYAILYHKKFYSVLSSHGPGRINELLLNLDLQDHIFKTGDNITLLEDFHNADVYLKQQKDESYKYLKRLVQYKKG